MQHDDPIGIRHLVAQMRRPQNRDRAFRAHAEQQLEQVAAACRVEADGRLVHQQHPRPVQQRARELDPPAVAAAEFRGLVVGALGKSKARELLVDMRLRHGARDSMQAGMEQEVGGDRELEIERRLLEHDAEPASAGTASRDMSWPMTSMRPESAVNRPERSWNSVDLAGAVGSEQRDEFAGVGLRLTPSTARIGP